MVWDHTLLLYHRDFSHQDEVKALFLCPPQRSIILRAMCGPVLGIREKLIFFSRSLKGHLDPDTSEKGHNRDINSKKGLARIECLYLGVPPA